MKNKDRYGVIGDPIDHSLSPQIHAQLSKQFGQLIDYQKYHVLPEELALFIRDFFAKGGKGLNVTVPHKQSIIQHLDKLTEESQLANSVNTLFVDEQGAIVGDTTDGAGLMLDLSSKGLKIDDARILVIGAGGASQSIIPALLKAGASIELLNRTPEKVKDIVEGFSNFGKIKAFDKQNNSNQIFDCVISSISQFNQQLISQITGRIDQNTLCYDLNYAQRAQMFKHFVAENGAMKFSDGLGMLICQAALSYQIWHKVCPQISLIKVKDYFTK
jgi:shikimate dehydrogenase